MKIEECYNGMKIKGPSGSVYTITQIRKTHIRIQTEYPSSATLRGGFPRSTLWADTEALKKFKKEE